ncbi:hypothetical protein [Desulfitobacterium sp. AusDCA]|uniref:hypothetical protein n=1 Tax=Desulfitobacterium sp. AusDCA TaxID=3240383 RepID=UPI003DA748B5
MGIDWNEINLIIQERSSKGSCMVQPQEMTNEDLAEIGFLIAEVNSFPDKEKTVAESGTLFRKYLSEKYCELSPQSINRLVSRFCFINR